jgi:hypothetical protein
MVDETRRRNMKTREALKTRNIIVMSFLAFFCVDAARESCAADQPYPSQILIQTNSLSKCVHLMKGTNQYSLCYYGQTCPHQGWTPLSKKELEEISPLSPSPYDCDELLFEIGNYHSYYRISARLATIDTRVKRGFAFGPCDFGFWAEYKWLVHLRGLLAYLADGAGGHSSVFTNLAQQLLTAGYVKHDEPSPLDDVSNYRSKTPDNSFEWLNRYEGHALNKKQRLRLAEILAGTEDAFMAITVPNKMSHSEVVRRYLKNPERFSRTTFGKYRIVE